MIRWNRRPAIKNDARMDHRVSGDVEELGHFGLGNPCWPNSAGSGFGVNAWGQLRHPRYDHRAMRLAGGSSAPPAGHAWRALGGFDARARPPASIEPIARAREMSPRFDSLPAAMVEWRETATGRA